MKRAAGSLSAGSLTALTLALLVLAVPTALAQSAAAKAPVVAAAAEPAPAASAATAPVASAPPATPAASSLTLAPGSRPAASPALPTSPASPGNMLQVMVGLLLVLGLLIGITWFMKKMGAGKPAAGGALKVVGGLSVGNRERILVVEVADQWIVVGVTPTTISALSTMPRQAGVELSPIAPLAKNFSDWLKQTVDKRAAAHAAAGKDSGKLINPGPDHGH